MNLTPAEAERLAMLIEEAAEIQQVAAKILRHGYESFHPRDPAKSNKDLLQDEIADFIAVHVLMITSGDLESVESLDIEPLIKKKLRWTRHQEKWQ